jgi:TRAP-type C4-dicarboxylate transport system permease small subunit
MEQQTPITGKTRFESILISTSNWLAVLACIALAIMMLLVTIDVAGRNFFNWPLRGTFEIVGLLLILATTWGLGLCQIERRHLRVPLFYDMFPYRVRLWLDVLAHIVCFAAAGLVTWRMLALALKYFRMALGNTTSTLGLPLFPFMVALALGFGWACVIMLLDLYRSFQRGLKR